MCHEFEQWPEMTLEMFSVRGCYILPSYIPGLVSEEMKYSKDPGTWAKYFTKRLSTNQVLPRGLNNPKLIWFWWGFHERDALKSKLKLYCNNVNIYTHMICIYANMQICIWISYIIYIIHMWIYIYRYNIYLHIYTHEVVLNFVLFALRSRSNLT